MIYHITHHKDWEAAQAKGKYIAESLHTEGFIHCSTITQVLPVTQKFYQGHNRLLLLQIDPALLSSTLKWEAPSGGTPPPGVPEGDAFPHIYGAINISSVVNTFDLVRDESGSFQLPKV